MEGASGSAADDGPIKASGAASTPPEISTDSGNHPGICADCTPAPEKPSSRPPYAESSAGVDSRGETSTAQRFLSTPTIESSRSPELIPRGSLKAGSGDTCDFGATESTWSVSTNGPAWPGGETRPTAPPTNRAVHLAKNARGLAHDVVASAREQQVLMQSEQEPAAMTTSSTEFVTMSIPDVRFRSGGASGVSRTTVAGGVQSVTCLLNEDRKDTDKTVSRSRVQSPSTEEMTQDDVTLSGGAPRVMATGEAIERLRTSVTCHADQVEAKYDSQEQGCVASRAATASIVSLAGAGSTSSTASECTRRGAQSMPNGVKMGVPLDVIAADSRLYPPAESLYGLVAPDIAISQGAPAAAVPRTPPQALTSCDSPATAAESSYGAIAPLPSSQGGAAVESLGSGERSKLSTSSSAGGEGPSAESLASMSGDERTTRAEHKQTEPPPWGEPIEADSPGDTADLALAAVSYANAVAEAEVVQSSSGATAGLESAPTDQQIRSVSTRCGKSENNTTVNDLGTNLGAWQELEGELAVSTASAAASATAQSTSRASSNGEAVSRVAENSCGSVAASAQGTCRADCSKGVRTATRGRKRSRARDHHEDLMHAMCMICLEKLSESSEGGGAKLLGLLDACSHRYCYTCILEWSKITNKCPQCKARFHTIKAIKELRRSNDRYRGVAVRVEDRDQVYSFVDVRDVVVLDPEVACRAGCLVRRGVDASQQGWEFSVQCEQCSNWYHGLCVGFQQEREVPDLWFCGPCRGEVSQIVPNPDGTTEQAANSRQSSGGNGISGRAPIGGQSFEGQDSGAPSVSGQERDEDVPRGWGRVSERDSNNNGVPGLCRTVLDGRRQQGSTSDAGVEVANVDVPQAPASPAQPVSAVPVQPPPPYSRQIVEATRGAAPHGLPQSSIPPPLERMLALFGAQQSAPATLPSTVPPPRRPLPRANSASPLSVSDSASSARGRGRPRGSKNKPRANPTGHAPTAQASETQSERRSASPPSAEPSLSPHLRDQQQQQHELAPSLPIRANSAPPSSVPVGASSARVRGRPRGSKNKLKVNPQEQTPATLASEMQVERQSGSPPLAEPSVSPLLEDVQQQGESASSSTEISPTAVDAPHLSVPVGASSSRGRGRPRGLKNKPRVSSPKHTPAAPASATKLETRSASPPAAEPSVSPSPEDEQQQEELAPVSTEMSPTVVDATSFQDATPRPPEPPAPSLLRSLEASQTTDLCEICGFDTEPENLIVYCESCNMGVHQTCYGISEIPTKEWYCSPCAAGVHPSTLACRFCPVKGGALKICTDKSWGHILCAFWIPECCFLDPQKMEPIGSINRRGQAGGVEKFLPPFRSRKCYVCGTSGGSAIRCHTSSCKFHLHPMCGSKAGSVYMEIETMMKRGADGTEHEGVNLVARCPRHNKNKTNDSRTYKSRDAIASAADPLSVVGRTLEITDPERGDVVLAGKVTWFDPERSRYCIVESFPSGGGNGGCGEPKESCSHWITVEKLIEAKAMGVQKNGNTFMLEPLPSLEGGETEKDKESGYRENRVKIEKEVAHGEEGFALSEGANSESKQGEHEREGSVAADSEKTMLGEEHTGSAVASKRRRMNIPTSPISPSDAAPAKRAARLDARPHQATARLQPLRPEPVVEASRLLSSQVEGAQPSVEHGVGSESGKDTRSSVEIETLSAATGRRSQQQPRLLPSVQLQDRPDPFSRYPIRGRLRRPTNPAINPSESPVLEGVSSPKRPRVEEDVDQSLTVTTDTVHSGSSEVGNQVSFRQTPQAEFSTEESTVSATGVEPCKLGSICNLQPGWPHGMNLLGQVPVMRVHAVRLPGGGEARYFASAYSSVAESVVFDERSAPRFSFRFEELEEIGLTDRATHAPQPGTNTDLFKDPEWCPGGAPAVLEGQKDVNANAENEAQDGEAALVPPVGELGQGEKGTARGMGEEMTTVDQTSHVSSDGDCVKDGEIGIDTGQANGMPLPRGSDESIGDDVVERAPDMDVQGTEEGAGSNRLAAQTMCQSDINQPILSGDDENGTKAEEAQEMDVSSDGVSCGGFEGAEAASPCVSEDDDEGFDMGWVACRSPHADDAPNSLMLGAGSALSVPPPSTAEMTQALGRQFYDETGGAVEDSESSLDDTPLDEMSEDARTKGGKSTESAAIAKKVLPTKRGEGPMSGLREGMTATESETEMAPQQTGVTLALRSIVREQLQGVLRSAAKGGEAALAGESGNDVERIASDTEDELFHRLYKDSTGGREYKAKYKQLLLSLGNVRNYRLVASVLAGNTTPADLAAKDAVGLLNSLSSNLNCLAIPLAGRHRHGTQPGSPVSSPRHTGKGKRRGKMMLL